MKVPSRLFLEEMRSRLLPCGKTFQPPAIDQKNIQPAVVVVVVEGDAAAGGFEQILVFVFAAEDCFRVEAGFAGDVQEVDAEIGVLRELPAFEDLLSARSELIRTTSADELMPSTFSSDSTRAERLRDLRNMRREENKSVATCSPGSC